MSKNMRNSNLKIKIAGARQHNLKNVSLEIPHYKLIAVTGVSGSGKTSFAFDTIANEGRRQYLESIPTFARQFSGKVSKPDIDEISGLFPVITVSQKITGSSVKSTVGTLSEIYDYLRLLFSRFGTHPENIKLSRSHFSFNSSLGACSKCYGIGEEEKISINKLVADPNKTLREGALVPTLPNGYIMYSQVTVDVLNTVCEEHGFNVDIPWKNLTDEQQNVIMFGSEKIKVLYGKHSLESRLKWSALKAKPREEGFYKGMIPIMEDILRRDRNKNILRFVESVTCSSCKGKRLNKDALLVHYSGKTIDYLSDLELTELKSFCESLSIHTEEEKKVISKIINQLELLCNLGLSYLHLSRNTTSLTSGEIQKIRLVNQLSADLSNVLYVFDEPSIGMHPRDNKFMIHVLKELVNKGNTVIIVEHDLETIRQSDWVIEIGPEAGINGGKLLYNGKTKEFLEGTKTGKLTHTQNALIASQNNVIANPNYQNLDEAICLEEKQNYNLPHCNYNNLKNINVTFKESSLNVITGVPGSGKKSLIYGCLIPSLNHVIKVDQKPIGRTPRSNPATYTGLSDHIRDLFAALPEAKEFGFKKGRFSFNNKGGRCEVCEGAGKIQIGMHYMGNVEIVCESCEGKRFNDETLVVKYKNKSISDIYDLSINQAYEFFEDKQKVLKYLEILKSLGLGYLKLGQSSTTLSGGEAQRIKLAKELVKKAQQKTWFILDEPSTGLHYHDTLLLIKALKKLADQGNTVVYLEYQEQLIEAADWIIEIGPDSGKNGGELIFEGIWNDFKKKDTITSRSIRDDSIIETKKTKVDSINIINARTNNLKGIDVHFLKEQITVITGVSGSGKSSLAFDTLFAESQTRFSESLSTYTKSFIKQSNFAKADAFENLTPVIAIHRKNLPQSPRSTVGTLIGINEKYRFLFSRIAELDGKKLSAKSFSFNHESGACPVCSGLGIILTADPHKIAPDWNLSIRNGALTQNATIRYYGNPDGQFVSILKEVAVANDINLEKSLNEFSSNELSIIFYGTGDIIWKTEWKFKTKTDSGIKNISGTWKGFCNLVDEEYNRSQHNKTVDKLEALLHAVECKKCNGARLNEKALSIKINGLNIHELSSLSNTESIRWFSKINLEDNQQSLVNEIYSLIEPKLNSMIELGLGHLSLSRDSKTLSGGEGQRLQLAKHLNGSLVGITYILDEPTIGLHQRNVNQLLQIIQKLKENGNTIIIVEHDKEVIKFADHIIEIGHGSGNNGGEIVAKGNYKSFIQSERAITPPFLKSNSLPKAIGRTVAEKSFGLIGVNRYNLVDKYFHFISNGIIALTGVSGSGKSTLIHQVLAPSLMQKDAIHCKSFYSKDPFNQVITVDQRSLQGTRSSTLATFIGILPLIQQIFASSDNAKRAKLKANSFSFNHKDGKCPHCNGIGKIKISMDFMEDVWNNCDVCDGKRYKKEILQIKVNNESVFDILNLSVLEAYLYFNGRDEKPAKKACIILYQLMEIGLGHLKLIQTTSSLSGGESQRLKISVNLLESAGERTLFLLDEPSSGLHYKDLDELIKVINKLVDSGHTVLFIEHNPYLISIANQVVELN
jgi:excinuclease ABC subunit A